MQERRRLREMAQIHTGYTYRGGTEHDPEGRYAILQPSDLTGDDLPSVDELSHTSDLNPRERHFVDDHTVLFLGYGARSTAVKPPEKLFGAVPTNLIFLIKVHPNRVDPGYLAWYLNSPRPQHTFDQFRHGSTVGSVRKSVLQQIEIPLPPLRDQRRIGRIYELLEEENRLQRLLTEKRQSLIHHQLRSIVEDNKYNA